MQSAAGTCRDDRYSALRTSCHGTVLRWEERHVLRIFSCCPLHISECQAESSQFFSSSQLFLNSLGRILSAEERRGWIIAEPKHGSQASSTSQPTSPAVNNDGNSFGRKVVGTIDRPAPHSREHTLNWPENDMNDQVALHGRFTSQQPSTHAALSVFALNGHEYHSYHGPDLDSRPKLSVTSRKSSGPAICFMSADELIIDLTTARPC